MSASGQKKIRLAYVASAHLLIGMEFLRAAFTTSISEFDSAFGTLLAISVTMACVADSAALGRPMVHGARFPFLVVWPLTVPVYVLRSRGWWGIAVLIMHMAILFGHVLACAITRILVAI